MSVATSHPHVLIFDSRLFVAIGKKTLIRSPQIIYTYYMQWFPNSFANNKMEILHVRIFIARRQRAHETIFAEQAF